MEWPEAYCEKWRIARKPHKCCECGGRIFYKERYLYISGVWDGRGASYKTCSDCSELRDIYNEKPSYDDGCGLGGMVESILEGLYIPDVQKLIDIWDKRGVLVKPGLRELIRNPKSTKYRYGS